MIPSHVVGEGAQNGVMDVHLISKEEVYNTSRIWVRCVRRDVRPRRRDSLHIHGSVGLRDTGSGEWCDIEVEFQVESVQRLTMDDRPSSMVHGQVSNGYVISNRTEEIHAKWVINAAGLFSDEINDHFGHGNFKVTPRRGELIVYDKLARPLVNHVLFPVPTATTKGVLISPTVYGNILLGPTAEDLPDKTATNTSANGLQSLLDKGKKILPELLDEEVTATYAGLRAATEHSDYQIALHAEQKYICVGGIRSTGISASLGIAEYVVDLLKEGGVELQRKPEFKIDQNAEYRRSVYTSLSK